MALNFRHILTGLGMGCMHDTAQAMVNDPAIPGMQCSIGQQPAGTFRKQAAALRGKNFVCNRKGLRSGDADDSNRSGSRPCRDGGNGLAHIIDLISISNTYSA